MEDIYNDIDEVQAIKDLLLFKEEKRSRSDIYRNIKKTVRLLDSSEFLNKSITSIFCHFISDLVTKARVRVLCNGPYCKICKKSDSFSAHKSKLIISYSLDDTDELKLFTANSTLTRQLEICIDAFFKTHSKYPFLTTSNHSITIEKTGDGVIPLYICSIDEVGVCLDDKIIQALNGSKPLLSYFKTASPEEITLL